MLKSRQMFKEYSGKAPETNGLTMKANILITWISMPEIHTNVPRHQDQRASYYR